VERRFGSFHCRSHTHLQSGTAQVRAEEQNKWLDYDREVFENPDTVGASLFVTTVGTEAIGFASWDPRQGPELAVIGHNCVLPEHQGRGRGKAQIREVLRRLTAAGFRRALATTSEDPFFEPARRMYLACGFREARGRSGGPDPRYQVVDYEITLRRPDGAVLRNDEQ
jgi:GNAT superfamily N-acetyltransferase